MCNSLGSWLCSRQRRKRGGARRRKPPRRRGELKMICQLENVCDEERALFFIFYQLSVSFRALFAFCPFCASISLRSSEPPDIERASLRGSDWKEESQERGSRYRIVSTRFAAMDSGAAARRSSPRLRSSGTRYQAGLPGLLSSVRGCPLRTTGVISVRSVSEPLHHAPFLRSGLRSPYMLCTALPGSFLPDVYAVMPTPRPLQPETRCDTRYRDRCPPCA